METKGWSVEGSHQRPSDRWITSTGVDAAIALNFTSPKTTSKIDSGLNEDKKESPYQLVSKSLVFLKSDPTKFYFRYQDHNSSYLDTKYVIEGNSIEKLLFQQYMIDTKSDYSKYQNGLENTLNYKVMSLDHIKRIKILKQEYTIL